MLTWNPAGDVSVTCMRGGVEGGVLLARGVVRSLLGTGTVLESTAGMVLRTRSELYTVYLACQVPVRVSLLYSALTWTLEIEIENYFVQFAIEGPCQSLSNLKRLCWQSRLQ